mgnify:CR=1 FL=1
MLDLSSLAKYLLEGVAVALAAFYIPGRNMNLQEVGLIAVTAAATFAVLDYFVPSVAMGARHGSGFGIGQNLVGGADPRHYHMHGIHSQPIAFDGEQPRVVSDTQRGGSCSAGHGQQGGSCAGCTGGDCDTTSTVSEVVGTDDVGSATFMSQPAPAA